MRTSDFGTQSATSRSRSRSFGGPPREPKVERIWWRGAVGFRERPRKSRLGFNHGSCIRLRPERPNHVWSQDFVESRTRRKKVALSARSHLTRSGHARSWWALGPLSRPEWNHVNGG